jgi:gliding motility-associated-like protein
VNYNILIDNAVSSDAIYAGLTIDNLSLINLDDDNAGISVIALENQTSENGDSVSIFFVLNSEPLEDVSFELSSDDLTEGTIDVLDVMFNSDNWSDTLEVIVIGQDDEELDGDMAYNIIVSGVNSLDPKYDGIALSDIAILNMDNDERELIFYEAFSPGGDDIYNQYYVIENLEFYDRVSIKVYNRWGSLVYENGDYQNDWDGKSNVGSSIGSDLPTGTYFYVVEISDISEKVSGYVFIKR